MGYLHVNRAADGSLYASKESFPPAKPEQVWGANYLVGWQDGNTPIVFPGCFPWLPPGWSIMKDPCPLIPDRAAICRANRDLHARNGITRSLREFFPGQVMGKLAGQRVIMLGSGPSLGQQRQTLERARAAGIPVVAVNGAIQAVPNADVAFCLERCAKPEWWKEVNPRITALWTSPSCHYSVVEKWPTDRRWYFLHHWDVFDGWPGCPALVPDLPATLSCMVSSINCLQLLAWCGVAEIWLLGQDFAGSLTWGPDGAGHSGWQPGGYYWDGSFPTELHGEAATVARDRGGQPVATTSRLWIMELATRIACGLIEENAGIPVHNVSKTGILDLPTSPAWQAFEK